MALSPKHLEAFIAENGPYLYHGAQCRDGAQPETVVAQILREGILPNMREREPWREPPAATHDEMCNLEDQDAVAEWERWEDEDWHHPRPNHVYLVTDVDSAYGPPVFRIDIRKLDLQRFKADEDYLRDNGLSLSAFPHRENDPRLHEAGVMCNGYWVPVRSSPSDSRSMGEAAEHIGWGEHPDEADESLHWGVIAYEGSISPDALELHIGPRPQLAQLVKQPHAVASDQTAPAQEL